MSKKSSPLTVTPQAEVTDKQETQEHKSKKEFLSLYSESPLGQGARNSALSGTLKLRAAVTLPALFASLKFNRNVQFP